MTTPLQAQAQPIAKLVENLILADRVMQSKGVIWGDRYEELSKPLRKARAELDAALSAQEAEVGRLMDILRSWKAAQDYTAQYRHLSEAADDISGAWESAIQARDAILREYP